MYRTDPLNKNGAFDLDFFSSSDFIQERDCLIKYLNLEGFSECENDFFIDFRGRRWHINPNKKQRKKK